MDSLSYENISRFRKKYENPNKDMLLIIVRWETHKWRVREIAIRR